ncbi:MAG: hypothetical protein GXY49_03460 [Syntrophomonadaceae bacterium]|nr:hypothetical protein [Syntrophomonadaceae bacterium]
MSSGFEIVLIVFYVIFMLGFIAAMVFMVLAFWKGMRAHESIAESMKKITETLQGQAREAA